MLLKTVKMFIGSLFQHILLVERYTVKFIKAMNNIACPILHFIFLSLVSSVVEWLEHRNCDRHGLGSKPSCATLLCERHFTVIIQNSNSLY